MVINKAVTLVPLKQTLKSVSEANIRHRAVAKFYTELSKSFGKLKNTLRRQKQYVE